MSRILTVSVFLALLMANATQVTAQQVKRGTDQKLTSSFGFHFGEIVNEGGRVYILAHEQRAVIETVVEDYEVQVPHEVEIKIKGETRKETRLRTESRSRTIPQPRNVPVFQPVPLSALVIKTLDGKRLTSQDLKAYASKPVVMYKAADAKVLPIHRQLFAPGTIVCFPAKPPVEPSRVHAGVK